MPFDNFCFVFSLKPMSFLEPPSFLSRIFWLQTSTLQQSLRISNRGSTSICFGIMILKFENRTWNDQLVYASLPVMAFCHVLCLLQRETFLMQGENLSFGKRINFRMQLEIVVLKYSGDKRFSSMKESDIINLKGSEGWYRSSWRAERKIKVM